MKQLKPVVVYVSHETLRKLDAIAEVRALLGESTSRSAIVREVVEQTADRGVAAIRRLAEGCPR